VAAVTPGPSNIMLTAAGANVGLLHGLPCLLGVASGMGVMMFLVPLGLGSVVLRYPVALKALNWGVPHRITDQRREAAPQHPAKGRKAARGQTRPTAQSRYRTLESQPFWVFSPSAFLGFALVGGSASSGLRSDPRRASRAHASDSVREVRGANCTIAVA